DKAAARRLLAYLAAWQREHAYRFSFGTEVSLDLAADDGLMDLLVEAGFGWVFVGIESPDAASLEEARKSQNTRQDLLAAVHALHGHGLEVLAGFIVGFDHDTPEIFERQRAFIMRSGIQAAMIGLLQAMPRTPLHARLAAEGRLRTDAQSSDNSRLGTNVVPKGISYEALVDGYRALHQRLFSDAGIAGRVRTKLRHLRRPARCRRYGTAGLAGIVWRFATRGLLPGGPGRVLHFLRSVPWHRPRLIPTAVQDWIVGLSMRDFVDRHFVRASAPAGRRARRALLRLERLLERYRRAGSLDFGRIEVDGALAGLSLRLRGALDRRFYARGARRLERLLRRTRATVTLQVDDPGGEAQARQLQRLLRRLSRHGDRVRIVVRGLLRSRLQIDSSVFDLALGR
ncbi:MAG: B12-binding domain-containing radical SAM protein, partial [Planctomycetota bacterium]